MPQTNLPEIISKIIRKDLENGKSKKQIAHEMGITIYDIAEINNLSTSTTIKISKQKTKNELIFKIREEVKKKKTKIQVANELCISYYFVKKHTKDIRTIYRIPVELEQKIRDKVGRGITKRQVAEELKLSYDTVKKYTRDIVISKKTSPELIKQIRTNVKKYNSKIQAAKSMNISYHTVVLYTRDIKIGKGITTEIKEEIRKEVMNGKSKHQVSKDLNISYQTVIKYTKDLPSHLGGRPGIRGKTLEILKKLINDGYIICPPGYSHRYQTLRKYFPKVLRVHACGKTVIFLDDKSHIAVKALLKTSNRKIISYQELNQIIKIFDTKLETQERKEYTYRE